MKFRTLKIDINSSVRVLLETMFSLSDVPNSKDKCHSSNRQHFPRCAFVQKKKLFLLPSFLTGFLFFIGCR